FGATFLMPNEPQANIIMVCTGTGSAPFRAFTMHRERMNPESDAPLTLFFGARSPDALPYFGPLKKVPDSLLRQHLVYSRLDGQPKEYVQDRMRAEAATLAPMLSDPHTYVYVCGLKDMEPGVEAAFAEIATQSGQDWSTVKDRMRDEGRFHVETY
ncbi:MAG: benzoyl-CoA oxygenase, partial [Pseudomonadota bacterium]